jgi:hypothetical protein
VGSRGGTGNEQVSHLRQIGVMPDGPNLSIWRSFLLQELGTMLHNLGEGTNARQQNA